VKRGALRESARARPTEPSSMRSLLSLYWLSRLARPFAAFAGSAALVALAAVVAVLAAVPASPARAGEPPPPAASVPAPRATALDLEIRHLEKRLQGLRKARTEVNAGRPEPVALDDDARRSREADLKALREIVKYESSRTKALAALAQASDAATDAEARTALEAADREFLDAMAKIAAAREKEAEPRKPDSGQPSSGKSESGKSESGKSESGMSEAGMSDPAAPASGKPADARRRGTSSSEGDDPSSGKTGER
jgi:hypothetical protein